MINEQLTIPADYINTMLDQADKYGMDRQSLISQAGLDALSLEKGLACTAMSYGQLHHRIINEVGDEWFGLLSGGAVPKGAIKLLCQLCVHCKTLGDAITQSGEFFEVCRGFKVKHVFTLEGDQVIIKISKLDSLSELEFNDLMANTSVEVLRTTLAAWHGFVSWLIGTDIPLKELYYHFSQSEFVKTKNRYPVHYNHNFSGYSFERKYLTMPVLQREENIADFVIKAPYYAFIKTARQIDTVSQRVKALLVKSMGEDFPQAMDVAEDLNMSISTLHRKLANETSSFQKIKDEARMEATIHYLASPEMTLTTIAELVGFDDPSTFYRSFKKWTGFPPGEYRKKMQG